jgi:hypothetical protein
VLLPGIVERLGEAVGVVEDLAGGLGVPSHAAEALEEPGRKKARDSVNARTQIETEFGMEKIVIKTTYVVVGRVPKLRYGVIRWKSPTAHLPKVGKMEVCPTALRRVAGRGILMPSQLPSDWVTLSPGCPGCGWEYRVPGGHGGD